MPNVVLPFPLRDNIDDALGSEVLADLIAIRDVVNGALDRDNLSPSAAIKGSQLSAVAGERVATTNIEDDAVTAAKLRDDANVDMNRSVTTNHIRNNSVTTEKIPASAVLLGKIKTVTTTLRFVAPLGTHVAQTIASYDLTLVSPPAGVEIVNPLTFPSVHLPVALHLRKTAGGAPVQGTNMETYISFHLYADPGANKVYVTTFNMHQTVPIPRQGYEFVVTSLAIS